MPRTLGQKFRTLTLAILLLGTTSLFLSPLVVIPSSSYAGETEGLRPLLAPDALQSIVPEEALLLDDANVIEGFLQRLDGTPPNWKEIYGDHGAGHDERLFALNRGRDRLREGRDGLTSRLTFLWSGELSTYDSERGGFHVAMGPKLISTRWGVVRFKPDNVPSNLVAVPPPKLEEQLRSRVSKGERIEIDVVITGRLLPEESIIYDFAHDEPGQGMVMPVMRVQQVDYVLKK